MLTLCERGGVRGGDVYVAKEPEGTGGDGMSYRIGSFNICGVFEWGEAENEKRKNPQTIAQVVRAGHFDILALQELRPQNPQNEDGKDSTEESDEREVVLYIDDNKDYHRKLLLEDVIAELNKRPGEDWGYSLAHPALKNTTGCEYAYIWNKRRVECLDASPGGNQFPQGGAFQPLPPMVEATLDKAAPKGPYVYTNYRRDYRPKYVSEPFWHWHMKREPFIARFVPVGILKPRCEIRLIDVHLFFTDEIQRREEYRLVTDYIYERIDGVAPTDQMKTVFTMILGDYNYSCDECGILSGENGDTKMQTVQSGLTTLNKSQKDKKLHSDGFASNYDHFGYIAKKNDAVKTEAHRINTVDFEKVANGDYTKHLIEVSDHVPICIEIL
jgi:endonuclease/exonuclease/phosphatase family metal-dependent hydrolase